LERDEAARVAFLDEACAGDESLRREVESLLESNDEAGEFLSSSALDVAAKVLANRTGSFPDRAESWSLSSPVAAWRWWNGAHLSS
jgi:hypothetical protein